MGSGGLLDGILVLDLADAKGSFCSRLLADLGATVVKIEGPEGSPERNAQPICSLQAGAAPVSLPFIYHNANKFGVLLDPKRDEGRRAFLRLMERADVLVETPPFSRLRAFGCSRQGLRRVNSSLIHVSITGFGRCGPKRNYHFSESVGSASGGQTYLSGFPSGPPIRPYGPQSTYTASLFGAVSVLLGLRKRRICGQGSFVDLSIQEAVASTLDHVLNDYFRDKRIAGRQGRHYAGETFSLLRCRDGYIQIPILRDWETLVELMALEKKAGDLTHSKWGDAAYRRKRFSHILRIVEGWTRDHARGELFELGQAMRFPWAPVESPAEVLASPQLKARRFFKRVRLQDGSRTTSFAGLPYKFSAYSAPAPRPAPLHGEHASMLLEICGLQRSKDAYSASMQRRGLPEGAVLQGVRVVDLTRMLSGPFATRILADFGAEVIKVQTAPAAQGAERNDAVSFAVWNRNKRGITLDLDHPGARRIFLRLISLSDVVVENFSPRVMANWGLTYDKLKEARPDIIMASISAMGDGGPWKDCVGYAPTFHALSGLLSAMSRPLPAPVHLGHAYGDAIAGLYAALGILAALEYRDRTGEGQRVDLSAYEAVCTLLGAEYMRIAHELSRRPAREEKADLSEAAVEGCYPCKGRGRWCVICIAGEEQWEKFRRLCGQPEMLSKDFSSPSLRRKNRARLDALIRRWTSRRRAGDVVRRLQGAGIASHVVQTAADLANDEHLLSRRFFIEIPHPALGRVRMDRSAIWPWRRTTMRWKASPLLGEHNRYVFMELLGMSEAEMRACTAAGIIR